MISDSVGEQICEEFAQVSGNRGVWESHWEEVARVVLPSYSGQFNSSNYVTPGGKRTDSIFDSTAPVALTRFAAVMESMLTPRNQIWHRLVAGEDALNKDRQVRLWLEAVNKLLFKYRYSPKANYASQIHQNYMGLGAFGTGCIFIDELDSEPGLRYKAIHLGEIYFVENHQGIIDKALRKFRFTARQAIQKWGLENLPRPIAEAKNPMQEFDFIHCVKPREDVDPGRRDYKGMEFVSYYVSVVEKKLLSEGGYNTFPYAISRYVQAPGETYGRSPAMDVLPAIKTLNEEKKVVLKQGHRTVDPILLVHDDGVLDSFSLKPGALNAGGVNAEGRPLVHTLPIGNVMIGKELMDDERAVINDAFLVTLFQILTESPQMTATEVLERVREKGMLLSPTMGRQQSEMFGPEIERDLDLLSRQGLLPPMPPALKEAGGVYNVEYDSPLSRAQKAEETVGGMRTVDWAMNVAQATNDPSILDPFDFDVMLADIADAQAVPVRWMRSTDAIAKVRAARSQQQEVQQAIDAAPAVASVAKTVGASNGAS